MPHWSVGSPTKLGLDRVTALRVHSDFGGSGSGPPWGGNLLSGQADPGAGCGRIAVTTMMGGITLLQRDEPGAPRPAAGCPGGSR